MSRSTLHRCLATYALLRDRGGVSLWTHISTSHVRAVLPLNDADSELELLHRAERERWPVRRLKDAVERLRGNAAPASAQPPLGEIAASLQREAERVVAGLRTDRDGAPRMGDDVSSSLRRARDAIHVALELARRSHRR